MQHKILDLVMVVILVLVSQGQARISAQTGASVAPGTVLASDDFSDPTIGILPLAPTNPAFAEGYVDGEYQLAKVDTPINSIPFASVPGTFTDTTIAVDARVVGDPTRILVGVVCRRGGSPANEYSFNVFPAAGTFDLNRFDAGRSTSLIPQQRSASVQPDNQSNHLELTFGKHDFSEC